MRSSRKKNVPHLAVAKKVLDYGRQNFASYRMPQSAVAKFHTGDTNGMFDDLLGWASLIPGAGKYVDMINGARKTSLGQKVEDFAKSKLGRYFGEGNEVAKVIAQVEKKEEKKIVKEAIKTGSRKIANITRLPRVLRSGKTFEETGCEPLQLMETKTGWATGQFVYSTKINPTKMNCPKLKRAAKGFELYHLSGSFKLKGGAGTEVPGTYIMYIDYDPMDSPDITTSGQANVQRAMSHKPTASGAAFDEAVLHIRTTNEPGRLYLDNDSNEERFTDVGTFYIVCVSPFPANVTLGMLYFDWHLTMSIPQEDPGVPTGDAWMATFSGTFDGSHFLGTTESIVTGSNVDVNSSLKDTGKLTLPPGSFLIATWGAYGTGTTFTGNFWTYALPAAYTPFLVRSPDDFSTPNTYVELTAVTSPGVWTMSNNFSAIHLVSSVSVAVCAISFSPNIANTFRAACLLMARAKSAKQQTLNVEKMQKILDKSTQTTPVLKQSSNSTSLMLGFPSSTGSASTSGSTTSVVDSKASSLAPVEMVRVEEPWVLNSDTYVKHLDQVLSAAASTTPCVFTPEVVSGLRKKFTQLSPTLENYMALRSHLKTMSPNDQSWVKL
jgi:hypothetical protein